MFLLNLLIFCFSSLLHAESEYRWINIGEADYKTGANTPYKIKLSLPYGATDLNDVKALLYPMKFELTWNEEKLSSSSVQSTFRKQLKNHFDDFESYKLYKHQIRYFLKKLPPVVLGEQWVFEYYPDQGIRLYIDGKRVHLLIGAQLNRALLKSWMDYNPFITSQLLTKLLRIQ